MAFVTAFSEATSTPSNLKLFVKKGVPISSYLVEIVQLLDQYKYCTVCMVLPEK